jgi:hypothetical protein
MLSRVPVAAALSAAARLLTRAWRHDWGVVAVSAAMFATLSWASFGGHAAFSFPSVLLVGILVLIASRGALYRVALGVGTSRVLEWRLYGVLILTLLFMLVLGLLAFVVLLSFAFAVASTGHGFVVALPSTWAGAVDGRGRVVLAVVGAAAAWGLIWGWARVSLGSAASVARRRVQVLASWPETRGKVAAILAGRAILLCPAAGAVILLTILPHPMTGSAALGLGAVMGGLWLPLDVGLMAYFYQSTSTA